MIRPLMPAPESTAQTCAQCGASLAGPSASGLCPKCLLGIGMDETAEEDPLLKIPSLPEDADSSTPGSVRSFGDYELLEEIGRGGMGIVYKARQRSLDRIVAVKLILAGQFAGRQSVQRFRGEAAAAGVLRHPNIVAIHEIGMHDNQHFFSMDYVEGQNLARLVGNRPLPAHQAARYVKLIAEAIQYAHEQGILHRDLKPSNVLVEAATDEPRVLDFGLARRLDGASSLTLSNQG
jgi:eukaryotic-like serine/threonine-protein kinase